MFPFKKKVKNTRVIEPTFEIGDKVWWSGFGVGCRATVASKPFVSNNGLTIPERVVLIKREGNFKDEITTSLYSINNI